MTIGEVVSLVNKAVSEHAHTRTLRVQIVPAEDDTLRMLGEVHSYFQKSMLITVVRKVCPDKALAVGEVVVSKPAE